MGLNTYKHKEKRVVIDVGPKHTEQDPRGAQAHEKGAKLDAGKSPAFRGLLDYFPRACLAVAEISQAGANKYTWKGWETVPEGINRYSDALVRHICKESIEGPVDPDFGLLHAAHTAWNALAVLELKLRETDIIKEYNTEKPNIPQPKPFRTQDGI